MLIILLEYFYNKHVYAKLENLERHCGNKSFSETGTWFVYIHNFLDESSFLWSSANSNKKNDKNNLIILPDDSIHFGEAALYIFNKLQPKDINIPEYKDGNHSICWHSEGEEGLILGAVHSKEHLKMDKVPATMHIFLIVKL